jgi:hypothetical protein
MHDKRLLILETPVDLLLLVLAVSSRSSCIHFWHAGVKGRIPKNATLTFEVELVKVKG